MGRLLFTLGASLLTAGAVTYLLARRDEAALAARGAEIGATLVRGGSALEAQLLARGQAAEPALRAMAQGIATPLVLAQVNRTLADYGITANLLQNVQRAAARIA